MLLTSRENMITFYIGEPSRVAFLRWLVGLVALAARARFRDRRPLPALTPVSQPVAYEYENMFWPVTLTLTDKSITRQSTAKFEMAYNLKLT